MMVDNEDVIYETYIDEDDDNVIEETIEEYGDYNYIEHIKDEDMAMEEEHLEEIEEDIKPTVTITRTVTMRPEVNYQQQPGTNVVQGAGGQIMIVQNTTGSTPIKLIQPQAARKPPPQYGIQMIRQQPQQQVQQQVQRVITQVVQQQQPPKYVMRQSGQQQIFLPQPTVIKQEPETVTRQFFSRPGLTISRTTNDQSPTILNAMASRKPMPPATMTVKQIRSPPAPKPTTILNRAVVRMTSPPQRPQIIQRVVQRPSPPSQRPNTSGSLQAVNIPGKGLQYVRVLNPQAPSNVVTQRTMVQHPTRILNSVAGPSTPGSSMAKMLLPGRASNTYTLISGGNQAMKQQPIKSPTVQRRMVPAAPVQPQKMIAVVKKEKDSTRPPQSRTTVLTTSQLNQLKGVSIIPGSNNKTKIVMLPSNYMDQLKALQNKHIHRKIIPKPPVNSTVRRIKQEALDDSGKKRRCNCTKSQCLKLYCDCFAAGEFCLNCNCKDCLNDQENEHERQKAIRSCLERNPNAFKPKIKEEESFRLHLKGCNCKRSGCLKNYCECYEAKVTCSGHCKCLGCHNFDPAMAEEKEQAERELQKEKEKGVPGPKRTASESGQKIPGAPPAKQPFNFMTPDVVEATVQCMIAQAEECQKRKIGTVASEKMILEEFGRCLVEIIDFSIRNEA